MARARDYRLTFTELDDVSKQPQGVVTRQLTDVQVERLRRHMKRPASRLVKIEPMED